MMIIMLVLAHINDLVVSLVAEGVVVRDLRVGGEVGAGGDPALVLALVETVGHHGAVEEKREKALK